MSSPSFGSNNYGYHINHNDGTINGFIANIRNASVYVQQTPLQLKEEEIRINGNWLKAPNTEINQVYNREKRHEGTGEWFLNSGSFRDWLSTPDSFLWVHGVPGSGKSVLFSTAVENIKRCHADAGLAFFYFDFNDPSKLNASGMLRSLIFQLLKQGQENDCVKSLWQVWISLDFEESLIPLNKLIICLRYLAQQFANVYILLDALDVCPNHQKRECVLESIDTMRQWGLPALHLLVSSHDTIDIRQYLDPQAEQEVNMRNPDVDRDISNYVYHELTTRKNLLHWRNDRVYLQAELEKRAQGVFLYVSSQLQEPLKEANLKSESISVLQSLPLDMQETYERLLRRILDKNVVKVRRVMNLLCYSNRPLTTEEVCHALAVSLQKPSALDLERLLQDALSCEVHTEEHLRRICCNLIDITRTKFIGNYETSIITISHSLLRQYLESEEIRQHDAAEFAVDRESANREIAQICLVYLLCALSEETRGSKKISNFPFALFAAMEWFNYYSACQDKESGLQDLALQLFYDGDGGYFTAWIELYDVDGSGWSSFPNLDQPTTKKGSPLYYASILGLEDIVYKILSDLAEMDVNAEGGRHGNALEAASLKGHTAVVQLLLERGADVNMKTGAYGTALQAASVKGHTEVVKILLGAGADPNTKSGKYGTALRAASSMGNKKIVQILLDAKANAKADSDTPGSALQVATSNSHEEIKNLLLKAGAHSSPRNLINELQLATLHGDLEKMEDILNSGEKLRDDCFQTAKDAALLAASSYCYEGAVRLLLKNGANVNAQAQNLGNPLYSASLTIRADSKKMFYESIGRMHMEGNVLQGLTAGGALGSWLVDKTCSEESNREQILEMLWARLVNDSRMMSFYKYLFPSPEDSEKVVRILLSHGANVNAQGGKYGNALQAASYIGNERVVKLLLEKGADVKSEGGFYRSAIDAASANSHSGVMQILEASSQNCE